MDENVRAAITNITSHGDSSKILLDDNLWSDFVDIVSYLRDEGVESLQALTDDFLNQIKSKHQPATPTTAAEEEPVPENADPEVESLLVDYTKADARALLAAVKSSAPNLWKRIAGK